MILFHPKFMLFSQSVVADSVITWNEGRQASLSFTISWILLKLMSIELVMSSNHLCPLSSLSSPALSLSQHQSFFFFFPQHQSLFSWVSTSHQVAKVFELQLQHQSSNAYSVLISFRIEWFDLSLLFKGLSSIFSNAIVQKNHYFGSQSSLWSKSHIHMQLLEKP